MKIKTESRREGERETTYTNKRKHCDKGHENGNELAFHEVLHLDLHSDLSIHLVVCSLLLLLLQCD